MFGSEFGASVCGWSCVSLIVFREGNIGVDDGSSIMWSFITLPILGLLLFRLLHFNFFGTDDHFVLPGVFAMKYI